MRKQYIVHKPASVYFSRGVTLVELVITIVIISVALVATLTSLSNISGRSSNVLVQSRALDLAQLYMDEILSKNFDEATGVGGVPTYTGVCRVTTANSDGDDIDGDGDFREDYDDVDDFNGLNEAPANVATTLGSIYANYTNYSVAVTVTCDGGVGANANGAKRISIAITDPIGNISRVAAYKGNY